MLLSELLQNNIFTLPSLLQKGLLQFQQSVELRSVSWQQFPDGWPNLFIENVKQDCAGRDGKHCPTEIHQLWNISRFFKTSSQAVTVFM